MNIGYARVSTFDQNLDFQIDALHKEVCQKIFMEKASGANSDRPELNKLLGHVRKGDTIIIWKLDRLGRSLKNLVELVSELTKKGVGLKSLNDPIDTSTSQGRLVFNIFASLAEFEKDIIRERTMAGLKAARARGRDASKVLSQLNAWVESLDKEDPEYEHHILEALWVTWGLNSIDTKILNQVLSAKDFRARAAAVRVIRYGGHQLENQVELLMEAARDESPRVRMEAMVAASWLEEEDGLPIVEEVKKGSLDKWMDLPYQAIVAHFEDHRLGEKKEELVTHLKGKEKELFVKGLNIYRKEGYCGTCHQDDGKGLTAAGFPPLADSEWVTGNEERLIKLTLKGLIGPIEVKGKKYPGQVPMTQFGGMLDDEEIAAVLTYVRNSFGNKAPAVNPQKVKAVRDQIKDKQDFYLSSELLKEHPFETSN